MIRSLLLLAGCGATEPPAPSVHLLPDAQVSARLSAWYALAGEHGWGGVAPVAGRWEAACAGGLSLACARSDWGPDASVGLAQACSGGDAFACALGGCVRVNAGEEPLSVLPVFERACGSGEALGCAAAGALLLQGGDFGSAVENLQGACGAGWGPACAELGRLAWSPPARTEWALALPAWDQGCRLGDPHACAWLADGLEVQPLGVAREDLRPTRRYACEAGLADACAQLLDEAGARGVLGRACTARHQASCVWLAADCATGRGESCHLLGGAYLDWPENRERGGEALRLGCAAGHAPSCAAAEGAAADAAPR